MKYEIRKESIAFLKVLVKTSKKKMQHCCLKSQSSYKMLSAKSNVMNSINYKNELENINDIIADSVKFAANFLGVNAVKNLQNLFIAWKREMQCAKLLKHC